MTGLFRFDFYPRDWITGTRGLSAKARGVYIDLIATMYDHGINPYCRKERNISSNPGPNFLIGIVHEATTIFNHKGSSPKFLNIR